MRGRQDFSTAFGEFDQWLTRAEKLQERLDYESSNPVLLKNAPHRKTLLDQDKVGEQFFFHINRIKKDRVKNGVGMGCPSSVFQLFHDANHLADSSRLASPMWRDFLYSFD